MTPLDASARANCAALAAWLKALAPLSAWSLVLAALALAMLAGVVVVPTPLACWAWAGVVLAALAERCLVLRLRFDAALFEALADGRIETLAALDDGLHALALRAKTTAPRGLDERIAGTRALVRRWLVVVGLQTTLTAAALLIR